MNILESLHHSKPREYKESLEYYYVLRKEIAKLRDEHTFFYPPSMISFLLVFSYIFIIKNTVNQILVYACNNANFHVVEYYSGKIKRADIYGKLI